MFRVDKQQREQLDQAGRLVLKAAVGNEADAEAAASSPFLFTRVRAAIAEERRRKDESGNWFSVILVARRAVPVMAMVAILAAVLTFWTGQFSVNSVPNQPDDEALFGVTEPGVEQTVLASRNGLSRDEVFNIVVDRNYER